MNCLWFFDLFDELHVNFMNLMCYVNLLCWIEPLKGFFARACLGRHGHDGLAGPSGQPGTARGYLGRAWAVVVARGLARHGTACSSGRAGPTDLGPGPVVPGPCRAGRPIWPTIYVPFDGDKRIWITVSSAVVVPFSSLLNMSEVQLPFFKWMLVFLHLFSGKKIPTYS